MIKQLIFLSILINETLSIPLNDIQPVKNPFETVYDEYGCCNTCGYLWCEELNACVRVRETFCESLQNGH